MKKLIILTVVLVGGIYGISKLFKPEPIVFQFFRESKPTSAVKKDLPVPGELSEKTKKILSGLQGEYSWFVYRLSERNGYGEDADKAMEAVSLMKVPVMIGVWKKINNGELDQDATYMLEANDKADGSGPLYYKPLGYRLTIDEALSELGKKSDNTAWRLLNNRLGAQTFQDALNALEMKNSTYTDRVITARDAAKMFEAVYDGKLIGEEGKKALYEYLTDSIYEDIIPAAATDSAVVVHKMGIDTDIWEDAGIVEIDDNPFVLVILNKGIKREEAKSATVILAREIINYETSR